MSRREKSERTKRAGDGVLIQSILPADLGRWVMEQARGDNLSVAAWLRTKLTKWKRAAEGRAQGGS